MTYKYICWLTCFVMFTYACESTGTNVAAKSHVKPQEPSKESTASPYSAPKPTLKHQLEDKGVTYELTYGSEEMGLEAYSFYLSENFNCGKDHGGSGVQCFSDIYTACEIPIDGNLAHQATLVLNVCQKDANAMMELNEEEVMEYFDKLFQAKKQGCKISYQLKKPLYFILSGINPDGQVFYEKMLLDYGHYEMVSLTLTYAPEFKTLYDEQIPQIFKGFEL